MVLKNIWPTFSIYAQGENGTPWLSKNIFAKLLARGCTILSVTKRKTMIVDNVLPSEYAEMLDVWENSVRATHDFITEEDIAFFKPIILEHAFPVVTLKCIKNDVGAIIGFIGVHQN